MIHTLQSGRFRLTCNKCGDNDVYPIGPLYDPFPLPLDWSVARNYKPRGEDTRIDEYHRCPKCNGRGRARRKAEREAANPKLPGVEC